MTFAEYDRTIERASRLLQHPNPDVRGTACDRIRQAKRVLERSWVCGRG